MICIIVMTSSLVMICMHHSDEKQIMKCIIVMICVMVMICILSDDMHHAS
jgi:hypothetical protein